MLGGQRVGLLAPGVASRVLAAAGATGQHGRQLRRHASTGTSGWQLRLVFHGEVVLDNVLLQVVALTHRLLQRGALS